MQGLKRKVVYVTLYELIAIVCSTWALAAMSGHGLGDSGGVAVAASCIAVAWNLVFNTLFEAWEARQRVRGRIGKVDGSVGHAVLRGWRRGTLARDTGARRRVSTERPGPHRRNTRLRATPCR